MKLLEVTFILSLIAAMAIAGMAIFDAQKIEDEIGECIVDWEYVESPVCTEDVNLSVNTELSVCGNIHVFGNGPKDKPFDRYMFSNTNKCSKKRTVKRVNTDTKSYINLYNLIQKGGVCGDTRNYPIT